MEPGGPSVRGGGGAPSVQWGGGPSRSARECSCLLGRALALTAAWFPFTMVVLSVVAAALLFYSREMVVAGRAAAALPPIASSPPETTRVKLQLRTHTKCVRLQSVIFLFAKVFCMPWHRSERYPEKKV